MKLVLLDGCPADDSTGALLSSQAEALGVEVARFILADTRLAPCLGDFECWTKTPGLCRTRDTANDIAAAVQRADLLVLLSPITFGGYGAPLKFALDRLIGLIHPCFHERDGLTRHRPRYARYPSILFVGCGSQIAPEAAALFRDMATGNAINLIAPRFFTGMVDHAQPGWREQLGATLEHALHAAQGEDFALPDPASLAAACAGDGDAAAPRRVTVFVGSARPKGSSTSEYLAGTMLERFLGDGMPVSVVYASQFIKPGRAAQEGLASMLAADLLIVAAPIYVDGLPALVVRALSQLAGRLREQEVCLRQLAGVLNCGYPEAVHNQLALRQLRLFAQEQGLSWRGGLALGGGEAVHSVPARLRPRVLRDPRRALVLAAEALGEGRSIPADASALMAKALFSPVLYRLVAALRWRGRLFAQGLPQAALHARPHASP